MSALVTKDIEKLVPYAAGMPPEQLARERGVSDAIKLASNENPLGPSPRAVAAATAALADVCRYPDANAFQLRTAMASGLGVAPSQIVFGNGSNELIELVVRTFTTPDHHAVFCDPSFVVYRMACLAQGVAHTVVRLGRAGYDLEAVLAAVRPNTRVVFLANPNNPTGAYVGRDELVRFLGALDPDVLVVLDEAYFEYATALDYPNGLELLSRHPRLVVLRTFSKAYGLAGLRVGYGVCSAELAGYLERVRAPFNVSAVAQAAALAAWADRDHLRTVVRHNATERARVVAALEALDVTCWPSEANFVLAEFQRSAAEVHDRLLDRGVIVRPLPGLDRALRISIGLGAENDRLLSAMAEVLRTAARGVAR
jgi:histidinol-phosphate aminotransferase